jgi:hypothetical protein
MSVTVRNRRGASLTIGTARITKQMKAPSGALLDVPVKSSLGPRMLGERALQEHGTTLPNGDLVTWSRDEEVTFKGIEGDPQLWLIDEEGQQVRSICAVAGGPRPRIAAQDQPVTNMTNLTRSQAEEFLKRSVPDSTPEEIEASLEHENGFTFRIKNTRYDCYRTDSGYRVEIVEDTSKRMSWQVHPSPMDRQSGPQTSDPTSERLLERLPGAPKITGVPPHPPIGFDAVPPKADPRFSSDVRPTRTFLERRCRQCGDGFSTLSPTRSLCDAHAGSIKR